MEPQLPKTAPQLPSVRLAQRHSALAEKVDPKLDLAELLVGQRVQPFGHLRFQLDLAPRHIPR
jgi:hypothetical protein